MGNFVFNVSKGRAAELYKRVDDGDPANSRLLVVAINTTATDATLIDLDTLAAVLGDANTAEATNSGYARKTIAAADIAFTVDDTNDRVDLDIPDQTWSAVQATGGAWTDLLVCYIPDGVTPGADSTVIPLTQHDFAVTPDGSDITAQVDAAGFYRAS
jgi:hypothetical protein